MNRLLYDVFCDAHPVSLDVTSDGREITKKLIRVQINPAMSRNSLLEAGYWILAAALAPVASI
jgi:hypothetical protein